MRIVTPLVKRELLLVMNATDNTMHDIYLATVAFIPSSLALAAQLITLPVPALRLPSLLSA